MEALMDRRRKECTQKMTPDKSQTASQRMADDVLSRDQMLAELSRLRAENACDRVMPFAEIAGLAAEIGYTLRQAPEGVAHALEINGFTARIHTVQRAFPDGVKENDE